ncbi:sensor histidine kinase [Kibdelosporangium aridum]|uniref:histidine kinase n=1 Tax=Kibdelosporangium aridum TaxID=2030 RepID=A0A428ZB20_KIBAR|nr:HAMP domain-containing sensor histidine kinase [Kibdelosporangium aridum]RSM85259.1 sensor histidine kinase [Kibdelosporangium aridum]
MPSVKRVSLGLRGRVILTFAIGAGLISLVLAVSVYTVSRGYLDVQRERSAERQASADADFVRGRLAMRNESPQEALTALDPPANTALLLYWKGQWFTAHSALGPGDLPADLVPTVTAGTQSTLPLNRNGQPFLAVGIPLTGGDALFEIAPLEELQETLAVLRTVLAASGIVATLGGAVLGLWASRRVLQPLRDVAGTAAQIAGGELDTRLERTHDRDLATITDSFNSMVDSLQRRIERERRFFGDVSHELRTPLTTLVTGVGVLDRYSEDMPERSQRALQLVVNEVDHLRRLLDDLLALARTEAGLHHDPPEPVSVGELLAHTMADSNRSSQLLTVTSDCTVTGRKLALERAFINLMDNADRHGGGLLDVTVQRDGRNVVIHVDDAGPGVPENERERVFERFATGHISRGDTSGTGLGLALVAETVAAHDGQVMCTDSPGGGARFTVTLPCVDD